MMSIKSSSSSIPSLSKRRHLTHNHEPPPVTFSDDRTPSARLNRAIQSSNVNLVKRLLSSHAPSSSQPHPIHRNHLESDQNNLFQLKQKKTSHQIINRNHKVEPLDPRNQDPVTRKTSLILATENSNLEICKILIEEYHVDSDQISRDLENNTILHLAAAEGLDDIISLYHSHYPFVLDWANSDGMTALHVASQKGNESTVSLLLDYQADVELTDNEGNTSLHYAAAWGHLKIVLLLIDRGSPFWAKNNQTFTASDYAYSFSIQSALQESARAHFESKKQQRNQRQHRDRDKERSQRSGAEREREKDRAYRSGSTSTNSYGTDTPIPVSRRLGLKDSHNSSLIRSNHNTPQLVGGPMIPKISTSPTNSTSLPHTRQIASPAPLAPVGLSTTSLSKPLSSPSNSIATARTVSYLISKDLEAIQDFRTKSNSLGNSTNPTHPQPPSALPPSPPALSGSLNLTGPESSSPPVGSNNLNSSSTRLLPLQLISGGSSVKGSGRPTLRARSSTGNLSHQLMSNSDGSIRNRAGSTDSSDSPNTIGPIITTGGIGSSNGSITHREGLSRLRYLKSSAPTHASSSSNPTSNVLHVVPGSPASSANTKHAASASPTFFTTGTTSSHPTSS